MSANNDRQKKFREKLKRVKGFENEVGELRKLCRVKLKQVGRDWKIAEERNRPERESRSETLGHSAKEVRNARIRYQQQMYTWLTTEKERLDKVFQYCVDAQTRWEELLKVVDVEDLPAGID